MQDALLATSKYLPAAAATNTTDVINLATYLSASPREDVRRLGFFRIVVPALPNHTDSTKTILIDMQDATNLIPGSFANTSPRIVGQVPGVASTGSLETTFDVPIPPDVRSGNIQFLQTVPSGDGNNTTGLVTYTWTWE